MRIDDVAVPSLFLVAIFFFALWVGSIAIHLAADPIVAQLGAAL